MERLSRANHKEMGEIQNPAPELREPPASWDGWSVWKDSCSSAHHPEPHPCSKLGEAWTREMMTVLRRVVQSIRGHQPPPIQSPRGSDLWCWFE